MKKFFILIIILMLAIIPSVSAADTNVALTEGTTGGGTQPFTTNRIDLFMTPNDYTLTLTFIDSATSAVIPAVTVVDNKGYSVTTPSGVYTRDYSANESPMVTLDFSSSRYTPRQITYNVVKDITENVALTPLASTPAVPNSNVVWQPRSVAIQILDANYNPIIGDTVNITAYSSSLPGGLTGAVDYFKKTYGVTDVTAQSMFNASVTYSGVTDDYGFVSTQVVDVIQYQVITHDVNGAGVVRLFWPTGPYYQIITANATTAGIAAQGRSQAAINMNSTFNTTFWEPNATYSCMGINVYDSSGKTTTVNAWWKLVDNGTVWWKNVSAVNGYGPVNASMCVLHVPYQQWKWGGITG